MSKLSTNKTVLWQAIPNSSQALAVQTRCHETLYCGTRGGGKSEVQLGAFLKYVNVGYGVYWRGIIFDQKNKSLNDLINKSERIFKPLGAKYNRVSKTWTFPEGETLQFGIMRLDSDYWNFHGQEFTYIGFNELTKYSTSYLYDIIQSCNRTGFVPELHPKKTAKGDVYYLPPIPLMMFSTTNPEGAGHNWVKQRFIDVAPYGQVVRKAMKVFNPRTQRDEEIERTQVAIFSSYRENIYLPQSYIMQLLTHPDLNLRKAWALGSWDIVSGGIFGDLWDVSKHVIPRFAIPKSWYIDRTFDWGSSHPFSVGWWAVANGEEVDVLLGNGKWIKFCPPRGSLIQFYEYYGSEQIGTNKGLQLPASLIAENIVTIEDNLLRAEWIANKPKAGAADNQIWNKTNTDYDTIADIMEEKGVFWDKSDKSSGSRVNGLQIMRQMLYNTKHNISDQPHIYFMQNCVSSISTLPIMPRDEKNIDDIDTTCEDHAWDMTRYRILNGYKEILNNIGISYG